MIAILAILFLAVVNRARLASIKASIDQGADAARRSPDFNYRVAVVAPMISLMALIALTTLFGAFSLVSGHHGDRRQRHQLIYRFGNATHSAPFAMA